MIFDVICVDVPLLLLLVINSVAPRPQEDVTNEEDNNAVVGNIEIGEDAIQGEVVLPQSSLNLDKNNNNELTTISSIISGSVEIDNSFVEGHIDIPNDDNQQDSVAPKTPLQQSADKFPEEDDVITGTIQVNDENIEGQVHIPDEAVIQDGDNEQENGVIAGSVDVNDNYVQGTLDIPSDSNINTGGNKNEGGAITGNIEINEDYVQGTVNIPSDIENQNDDNQQENVELADINSVVDNGDELKGTVEIDDDNIQGHIEFPDNAGDQVNDGVNDDNLISGTVKLDDDYVQGTLDIPYESNINTEGNQNEGGAITGNIEINEDYVQGTVNIPSDIENQNDDNQQENLEFADINGVVDNDDELKGTVEVDDGNIQGHIEFPDGAGDQVSGGVNDDNLISGTVELDDDYVQGHIDIPDDEENQDNGEDIVGSIDIDDDNIEGHIEIPGDSDDNTTNYDFLPHDENYQNGNDKEVVDDPKTGRNCWMDVKSKPYLDALDKLDDTHQKARQQYQNHVGKDFDKKMLQVLLASQGAAPRAIHEAKGNPTQIPAGINLGGYCMMKMQESLLFFHRMKLRNNTRFKVEELSTNLMNMNLLARLTMKELQLQGAYERSKTGKDPTALYHVPTFGELSVVLENVEYKMEGRLRLLNGRLLIELVSSNLEMSKIVLKYDNQTYWTQLDTKNVEDYLDRLKTDLDTWMKDYFNDYLMYFGIVGNGQDSKIQAYEKQKTVKANEYADTIIKKIKQRIRSLGASAVQLPIFKIHSMSNVKINLKSGLLRGLDSIYRRSVAMTKKEKDVRHLNFVVSFSKLKVEYQFEAMVYRHMPPLSGTLILSADELTAHVHVMEQDRTNSFAINFNSITQVKPESLTIEGPANRVIADYKHILEHPILSIMLNVLAHNIKMLTTLTRCEPLFKGIDIRQEQHVLIDPDNIAENKNDDEKDVVDENVNENEFIGEDNIGSEQGLIPDEEDKDNKEWVDYTFQKNDSVEIEVPIDGETQNFKLHRDEKFVLSKIP